MNHYASDNVFAKILRQEIPVTKIYEDPWVLVFPDIAPQAPLHLLIIPKGSYRSAHEFYETASIEEIVAFARATATVISQNNLKKSGYRLIANDGLHGGQEVPHYHLHLLAGEPLGPLRCKNE